MVKLSDRMQQLVDLVGGQRMTFPEAAREMDGISPRTLHGYADEARERMGLEHLRPRDALFVIWHQQQGGPLGPTMP